MKRVIYSVWARTRSCGRMAGEEPMWQILLYLFLSSVGLLTLLSENVTEYVKMVTAIGLLCLAVLVALVIQCSQYWGAVELRNLQCKVIEVPVGNDTIVANDCQLCNQQIGDSGAAEIVQCSHIFHAACLDVYMESAKDTMENLHADTNFLGWKYTCPVCNTPFNEIYQIYQTEVSESQDGTTKGKKTTPLQNPKL